MLLVKRCDGLDIPQFSLLLLSLFRYLVICRDCGISLVGAFGIGIYLDFIFI